MSKVLNLTQCKQFSPCAFTGGLSVLYAIRFTLPVIVSEPNMYIQDNFFDDSGTAISASGFFKWLPVNSELHNDLYFATNNKEDDLNVAYEKGIQHQDNHTIIDLMFITEICESLGNEVTAINEDLNAFVEQGYATTWEQIPFFPTNS